MKIVFKAGNIIEAHIVAGMLNSCDIPTYVGGHFLQGAVGDLSPTGFANVFVAPDDFEQACALVADYEKVDESQFARSTNGLPVFSKRTT